MSLLHASASSLSGHQHVQEMFTFPVLQHIFCAMAEQGGYDISCNRPVKAVTRCKGGVEVEDVNGTKVSCGGPFLLPSAMSCSLCTEWSEHANLFLGLGRALLDMLKT